ATLRDDQGRPVAAGTVLERSLRAMGIAEHAIPADLQERIALYRSTVARRRMLVVLDDAACESQVLPLLPGCSGTRVLVTSRERLDELVVRQGSARLPLGPLQPGESRELLALLLGRSWVDSSPHTAGRLAGMAGGNPLSLRRAAAGMS
ncbi:transcriptional regulator, partial [Streptomyces regensis]